jgi:hypothetical protein
MPRFVKDSLIHAPAARVWAFHEAPDAFARLQPPWQRAEVVQPPTSLAVGTRVIVRVKVGPFWQVIEAEHVALEPGRRFVDRMLRGPFAAWEHEHRIDPEGPDACRLIDTVDYALPLGALGRLFGGGFARRELERLFDYRHQVTRDGCVHAT